MTENLLSSSNNGNHSLARPPNISTLGNIKSIFHSAGNDVFLRLYLHSHHKHHKYDHTWSLNNWELYPDIQQAKV